MLPSLRLLLTLLLGKTLVGSTSSAFAPRPYSTFHNLRPSLQKPSCHSARKQTQVHLRAFFHKAFSKWTFRTSQNRMVHKVNKTSNGQLVQVDGNDDSRPSMADPEWTEQHIQTSNNTSSLQESTIQERDEEKPIFASNGSRMLTIEVVPENHPVERADTSVDIFSPSFTQNHSTNSNLDNQASGSFLQNETMIHEALEMLGPLTLSDPAFELSSVVNETVLNGWMAVPNSTDIKKMHPAHSPLVLDPNKLFSQGIIQLPSLPLPSANASAAVAAISSFLPSLNVTGPPIILLSTIAGNLNSSNNISSSNPYYIYDTKAALEFLESQANFTKQQMELAQRMLWETSANATKQLDSAQKALLEYGTQVLEEAAAVANTGISHSNNNNNNKGTTLSVQDLESYLRMNGYVRQADLQPGEGDLQSPMGRPLEKGRSGNSNTGLQSIASADLAVAGIAIGANKQSSAALSSSNSRRVAFPQPSVVSYGKVKWGSTVAASFLGLVGGITIFPNLWLLGAIFGGLYGYEITKNLAERPPTNTVSSFLVHLGRALTHQYLKVRDFMAGLWFMYKTGQLSYDYWKQYAALDDQFAIQSKIDAWNAMFQKGKENFDRWEHENEVGRKILAGLRTVWLVEEKSFKKSSNRLSQSRYRLVQYCYKAWRYLKTSTLSVYAKRGKAWKELQAFAEGMRLELVDPSQWQEKVRPRIAASLAALTFVNLTGVLFAVSPLLLGFLAVVLGGIVWPKWFSEWLSQVGSFFEETKAIAKGRSGESMEQIFRSKLASASTIGSTSNTGKRQTAKGRNAQPDMAGVFSWPFLSENEKEHYHFYRRPDGTKKWYRTGGSPWDVKSHLSNTWWRKEPEKEKPWWSLS